MKHVCRTWRRLVHLSPSRLHVHLLLTPCRSSEGTTGALGHLPPFPVLFGYSGLSAVEEEVNPALAAITHHSRRVRGITLLILEMQSLRALCHPFPELERLHIFPDMDSELILPATILSGYTTVRQNIHICLNSLIFRGMSSRVQA